MTEEAAKSAFASAMRAHSARAVLALARWGAATSAVFGDPATLVWRLSSSLAVELVTRWVGVFERWLGGRCKFELLFHGEGGFDVDAFHRSCDGKGPTITLVRTVKGSSFGGYTTVSWASSGGWKADESEASFVFIMESPTVRVPTQYPHKSGRYAVLHYGSCGPWFGDVACGPGREQCLARPLGFYDSPEAVDFDDADDGKFEIKVIEVWGVAVRR